MKFLTILSVLAIAIGANGFYINEELSDRDMFLRIIECSQKAIIDGLPDIGVPSHDPLIISHNFTTNLTLGDYRFQLGLKNMYMEGIPWWNVTKMDDKTVVENNPVFDYDIYWKLMTFEGTWTITVLEVDSENVVYDNEGTFGIELEHLDFTGSFNFSKPVDGQQAGFNDLILHLHTEELEFHIDNLGILSDIIKFVLGSTLTDDFNMDSASSALSTGIRDKLNNDWIGKPERIQALIDNCGTSSH